jgi:uncharacterized membrane-anchored protein
MNLLRALILGGVALLALAWVNLGIFQKETLIASGEPIFLELAPVDPRSLIQGDYMALQYAIARDLADREDLPVRGQLVLHLDGRNIATFARLYDGQSPLASNERLIDYQKPYYDLWLAPTSFFFEEGQGEVYQEARYAELRLDSSGEAILVDLRGPDLELLEPAGP